MFWKMKIAFKNTMDSHAKRLSELLFHRISLRLGWESKRFLNAISNLQNIEYLHLENLMFWETGFAFKSKQFESVVQTDAPH